MAADWSSSRLKAIYDAAERDCRAMSGLWEVTHDCNLRCRHCYVECAGTEPLSLDESVRVLDELAAAGVLLVVFSGGEPFEREDFIDILRAAAEREFAVRVLTNGTLVGEKEADALAGISPMSIDFSVYGNREAHERVTGVPGSHALTLAAIKRMRERGIDVRIKMPVMRSNLDEVAAVRELARSVDAELVFDTTLVCRPSGDRTPLDEQLDEGEIVRLMREALKGTAPDVASAKGGGNLEPGVPFCSAGRSTARITPAGELTPCVAIPTAAGSLKGSSFAELWNSSAFKRLRAMRLADLPECRECDLREWCVRCPGQALIEDGDVAGPSSAACAAARIVRRLADEGMEAK